MSTAIQTGLSAFTEESEHYKVFVLVTDGEDHEGAAIDLAETASDQGMIIHTVGVGTETGSLIPLIEKDGSREYKRDRQGILVTSVLTKVYYGTLPVPEMVCMSVLTTVPPVIGKS